MSIKNVSETKVKIYHSTRMKARMFKNAAAERGAIYKIVDCADKPSANGSRWATVKVK